MIPGSSTLPRATNRATETETLRSEKIATATSSTSLYDNVGANNTQGNAINAQGKQWEEGGKG